MGISIDIVIDETSIAHFICSICTELVENPVMLKTCEHLFCGECITEWRRVCETGSKCPDCRRSFVNSDIVDPNRILLNLIGDIQLCCGNRGCDLIVNYSNYSGHSSSCDKAMIQCKECLNKIVRSEFAEHKERFS